MPSGSGVLRINLPLITSKTLFINLIILYMTNTILVVNPDNTCSVIQATNINNNTTIEPRPERERRLNVDKGTLLKGLTFFIAVGLVSSVILRQKKKDDELGMNITLGFSLAFVASSCMCFFNYISRINRDVINPEIELRNNNSQVDSRTFVDRLMEQRADNNQPEISV